MDSLRGYKLITVIYTTQHFEGDPTQIPNDCLVICQENFESSFGHVFASRASFGITRDINPNITTPVRLAKTLHIPEALACTIGEKKPYRSATDLLKAVPELDNFRNEVEHMSFFPFGLHIGALDSPKFKPVQNEKFIESDGSSSSVASS